MAPSKSDTVADTFRDWLSANTPGLVTKDDLARLESRVDELAELLDEVEEVLDRREAD